jgi:hypothetical protein
MATDSSKHIYFLLRNLPMKIIRALYSRVYHYAHYLFRLSVFPIYRSLIWFQVKLFAKKNECKLQNNVVQID